jgi:hypothetical protein
MVLTDLFRGNLYQDAIFMQRILHVPCRDEDIFFVLRAVVRDQKAVAVRMALNPSLDQSFRACGTAGRPAGRRPPLGGAAPSHGAGCRGPLAAFSCSHCSADRCGSVTVTGFGGAGRASETVATGRA